MYTKEKLEKRIKRIESKIQQLKDYHGDKPSLNFTYHAGWDLGYYQGILSVLEELIDEDDEIE